MIKLIINAQELSIVTQKVVSGTHNYLTVQADFKGSAWTGLRKWVHFSMGPFTYVLPMEDDEITEEAHLDLTEGTWEVYVHGNLLEDDEVTERVTTGIKYLFVDAPHDGHPFPPLTPDFEEVLANQVMEAKGIAQSVRDDADAGEFDGATFTPSVSEEGIISWTNDQCKPNPEPVSIKGPKGDTGDSGVHVGTSEPTDPVKNVWINPNGLAGKVIISTEYTGTHQPGTNDTLKFNFSDGTSLTVSIYNGVDGDGTGDMQKSVYDTHNKAEDIFDYVDGTISDAVADLVESSDLATVATSGSYNDLADKPTIPVLPTVDSAMSDSSTNAVQNKVIKAYVDAAAGKTFVAEYGVTTFAEIAAAVAADKIIVLLDDETSAYDRQTFAPLFRYNPGVSAVFMAPAIIESGANVQTQNRSWTVTAEDAWSRFNVTTLNTQDVKNTIDDSTYPVSSLAIKGALDAKQNALTIDTAMSGTSTNPVQNKAIKQYVDSKVAYMVRTMLFTSPSDVTVQPGEYGTFTIPITPNPFSWATGGGREAYSPNSGKTGYRFRGIASVTCVLPVCQFAITGNNIVVVVFNPRNVATATGAAVEAFYTSDVGV